jgi:hypothetical protein
MTLVGFIPGPSYVLASCPDDRPMRWCYQCRKHLAHTWELLCDPPERQPSYYESVPVLRCERCHEDHTRFPGAAVDGPHYPESDEVADALTGMARAKLASPEWVAASTVEQA